MIIGLVIYLLTLAGKLIFDQYLHFSGKTIKHAGEAVIVSGLLVVASFFAARFHVERVLYFFPMFLMLFWAPFDTVFGVLIAKDPFYLGTTAKLDRLQKMYSWIVVAKYVAFALSLATFVFLLNNQ